VNENEQSYKKGRKVALTETNEYNPEKEGNLLTKK
jgi:hypothetical protein